MGTRHVYDQWGGVVRTVHIDTIDNRTHFVAEQDGDALLREVARAREEEERQPNKVFRPVAKIPAPVIAKAMIEGWYDDPVAWKRWLNDPDNRSFRITTGRV